MINPHDLNRLNQHIYTTKIIKSTAHNQNQGSHFALDRSKSNLLNLLHEQLFQYYESFECQAVMLYQTGIFCYLYGTHLQQIWGNASKSKLGLKHHVLVQKPHTGNSFSICMILVQCQCEYAILLHHMQYIKIGFFKGCVEICEESVEFIGRCCEWRN